MAQSITIRPAEKGTAVVIIAPVDEEGVALTIGQLTAPAWQLMKTDGTIINSRSFANGALASLEFVLSGNDLAMFGPTDSGRRVISFQATYDSDVGSNLPLKAEATFIIDPILGVADTVS